MLLPNVLLVLAILSAGVIYGVDVFFAVVARSALAETTDIALANVMGHLHKTADARMPVFGILAVVSTFAFTIVVKLGTLSSWLALIALAGLFTQLGLYFTVAKPLNTKMSQAVQLGKVPANIRQLQNRWDSVILGRAMGISLALACLVIAAVLQ